MANGTELKHEIDALKTELAGAKPVPYIVHEASMAREERIIKRLVIALIVGISLLFTANCAWLYAWCQYDYESYEQDGTGINIIEDTNEVRQNGTEIPPQD